MRIHGVELEDEDRRPHKQNKRRKGDGGHNEQGQMARTETLMSKLNPRSGGAFRKVFPTPLIETTATHGHPLKVAMSDIC